MNIKDIDLTKPPQLSEEAKLRLEALEAMKDEEIDTSDIPELTADWFKGAIKNPFYKGKSTTDHILQS